MSIIFGISKPAGQTVEREELTRMASATLNYAPDGTVVHANGRVGMGFQPFHTHQHSLLESQPLTGSRGNMLVFDGRLDNRAELQSQLEDGNQYSSDSSLVLAAFERWNDECFSRLVGDWALALWSARALTTYLARDHAGARSLYFQNCSGMLRWATHLESFFASGERYRLNEQFVTRYLCAQPVQDLTPYQEIQAVPPAHVLAIQANRITSKRHWNWIAKGQIHYKSDEEYEQHFLALFRQSVERRTGPGAPILAELSGGMDSTSIVCMSDSIRKSDRSGQEVLLDTISYYDNSEPNWNEEPYFSITEAYRGKKGIHLETSAAARSFRPASGQQSIANAVWPGADSRALEQEQEFHAAIGGLGYRTILSGVGGDEVLGGVPTPLPELGDLLVSANFHKLLKQATAWSLSLRAPLLHMLYRTLRFTAGLYKPTSQNAVYRPPWLNRRLDLAAFLDSDRIARLSPIGKRPSVLSNEQAWWAIQGSLPHVYQGLLARYEYRYPYLDRDLVDYLYRIPREQLIRPAARRSLMKRALKSIVPEEVLMRRRKAYIVYGPLAALRAAKEQIENLITDSPAADKGFFDRGRLREEFHNILGGRETRGLAPLINTLLFDLWLRAASNSLLGPDLPTDAKSSARKQLRAETSVPAA
jgi:asparagine synthase (glutamine-hydrolysing)